VLVVGDAAQARLLCGRASVEALRPFLLRECTLTEAAAELEVRPSTLAYWVPRFVDAGLVREVRRVRRAGRAMRVYRAVADEFRVPFTLVPPEAHARFVERTRRLAHDEFLDALTRSEPDVDRWGLAVGIQPDDGQLTLRFDLPGAADVPPGRGRRRTYDIWLELDLRVEDAVRLRRELVDLVERYRAVSGRGGRHLVHLGITPAKRR
jgi:DNA-binding transcriptional ArsR family regulator